ncbi:hypothetical protein VIBNISOn1_830077 [Vibrio nigripulchritudo SOn1]|uniref:Uncharacterized protein n=1 Tax=Vibrio nigripulchritudo SOn1 TaxID=1238450 RepID=A0AAV2VY00_9VIBR|nr:hypothetical protein VIBNISOn1_830077 [Vibrio nigripulchritudo SOn1]
MFIRIKKASNALHIAGWFASRFPKPEANWSICLDYRSISIT